MILMDKGDVNRRFRVLDMSLSINTGWKMRIYCRNEIWSINIILCVWWTRHWCELSKNKHPRVANTNEFSYSGDVNYLFDLIFTLSLPLSLLPPRFCFLDHDSLMPNVFTKFRCDEKPRIRWSTRNKNLCTNDFLPLLCATTQPKRKQ